ncbi:putative nuclease HARBI1 [Chenopodium quinoa]|uniref:putative nuclease HARBI1 n=1 Tax=Chenopodium quinoa TaxID=63459 RepID=UPI000B76CB06|nr:putative nuclease HARBI1 [Chenopodium quinoa]
MGETTARKCLAKFCEGVIKQYEAEYLRSLTDEDLRKILYRNEHRGFPGMIGSIDCMHWEWKKCPNAWKGQYCGRNKNATLILEAVADEDLWIWHSFFGIPGSCNDLNVLYRSSVFNDVLQGRAPPVKFTVNGHEYNLAYYLTDGIYPNWATFVQGFTHPQTPKKKLFADRKAGARKNVERAFGVLQARFAIIRQPALAYDEDILADIIKTCIIIHNMIVQDERDTYKNADVIRRYYEKDVASKNPRRRHQASTSATVNDDEPFQFQTGRPININNYLEKRDALRDRRTHQSLKDDLIEHIWQKFGDNNP